MIVVIEAGLLSKSRKNECVSLVIYAMATCTAVSAIRLEENDVLFGSN